MTEDERSRLKAITLDLIGAFHINQTTDAIRRLHDILGLERPSGSHNRGWHETDFRRLRE